jgi:glycosyltransferase involved in cell wall biosynthesis
MHVAQFVHRYPPAIGGAEAWAGRLSQHLLANGHRVTVWTTTADALVSFSERGWEEYPAGETVEEGVAIRRYRPSFRFPGRRYLFKAVSSLGSLTSFSLQSMTQHWGPILPSMWRDAGRDPTKPDVVHAIAFPHGSLIRCGLRLAQRFRVPFVLTPFLHLGDPDDPDDPIRKAYTAPYLRWLLKHADRVLVQTPTEERAVRDLGISAERIVLQGLGVESSECTSGNRERARTAWGAQPGEVVIGHLANLSLEKGTPDLLAAAETLQLQGQRFRVVLAGPDMPSFKFCRRFDNHETWITELGPLTDEQRRDFYAAIDLFVLPSRSDSFGLVFLEAWANGVPVIGYRAGGVADVIRHEQDGLLVKCGDLEALAAAMRRMVESRELREKWGRAGQARLERDFRWEDKLETARTALIKW